MCESTNEKNGFKKYTLIFVKNGGLVLLGLKKRGFGVDKWNGFGGKVEENEDIVKGAVRELKEESNLDVDEKCMKCLGCIKYKNTERCDNRIVYIFVTTKNGDPQETEEMKPKWFTYDELPYERMWLDTKHWMHMIMEETYFNASFVYDSQETINHQCIQVLSNFTI